MVNTILVKKEQINFKNTKKKRIFSNINFKIPKIYIATETVYNPLNFSTLTT